MDTLLTNPRLRQALIVAAWLLVAFLAAVTISTLSGLRYIGEGVTPSNTITVSGHGEVMEAPDIAEISFSVVSDASTVAAAQSAATTKQNAISDYLKSEGIADADIQTSGYSIEPQYTYQNAVCPQVYAPATDSGSASSVTYCPPGKQTLTGYETSQTTTVKVRDLTKAGDILTGVGDKGASNISGINFTFDNPQQPQDDARAKAIADAKTQAQTLASELGVSLGSVVSFQDSGTNAPRPMLYSAAAGSTSNASAAPTINPGQNTVDDDVMVTYEIR